MWSNEKGVLDQADMEFHEQEYERLRSVLVVQARVELVPSGTLQRSDYKSKLVEHDL